MAGTLNRMGLMAQAKIELWGRFKISKTNFDATATYHIEIKYFDKTAQEETICVIPCTEADISGTSTKYITFFFAGLYSNQMRDEMQITLYKNGVAESLTYTRTGAQIAKASIESGSSSALVHALMNYADCAKLVFG